MKKIPYPKSMRLPGTVLRSTKKPKSKPRPKIPELFQTSVPWNHVFLGLGETFKKPKGRFEGRRYHFEYIFGIPGSYVGASRHHYFSAPWDSEVVALNGWTPTKPPKQPTFPTKTKEEFEENERKAASPGLVLEVGKTYLTRDGREARVFAIDLKTKSEKPVVAGVTEGASGEWESVSVVSIDGFYHPDKIPSPFDLVSEKPDFDWTCLAAWQNVIVMNKDGSWHACAKDGIRPALSGCWAGVSHCWFARIPTEYAPNNRPTDWRRSLRVRPGYTPNRK